MACGCSTRCRRALQSAPGLRFIQMLSAGLDTVDFDVIAPDIMVAGNVGAYAHPIAEHVMAMVLCLAKRLPQENAALARGEWTRVEGDRAAATATLDGAVARSSATAASAGPRPG